MGKLKIELDTNKIIEMYATELKTIQDICKFYNVNYATIKLRLIKSGIRLRTTSESKKIVMNRLEVKKRSSEGSKRSQLKRQETNIKKYGYVVPASGINWMDNYEKKYGIRHPNKSKENIKKMIGDNNPSKKIESRKKIKENRWKNKSEDELKKIQKKQKDSYVKHFGVDNPLKSEVVKYTIRTNSLKNNGVSWPIQNPLIQQKIKNKKNKNYEEKIKERLSNLNLELIGLYDGVTKKTLVKCKTCNNQFETILDYIFHGYGLCKICNPYQTSISETELKKFISFILPDYNIIFNDRKFLNGLELDILIPDKNIAIEFNGIYFHSEKHGICKDYHLNKTIECEKKNIHLIHIFEDEWLNKKEIVKSRLKRILETDDSIRIHARKCKIFEITSKEKDDFLEQYHIQGKDISSVRLGAYYNNELISVMTFSKGNISKGSINEENIWELNRFCTKNLYNIPGIASKLFCHFKKNYEWIKIFSYCDRRWSIGNTYYKLGFQLNKITKPNYWYVKGIKRIHRFNLRKRSNEPKDVTEEVLRKIEGYYRIWDCGNLKFIIEK